MRIPDICPFLHLFWGLKVENSHETQKNLRPGQGGSVLYKIQSTKINIKNQSYPIGFGHPNVLFCLKSDTNGHFPRPAETDPYAYRYQTKVSTVNSICQKCERHCGTWFISNRWSVHCCCLSSNMGAAGYCHVKERGDKRALSPIVSCCCVKLHHKTKCWLCPHPPPS